MSGNDRKTAPARVRSGSWTLLFPVLLAGCGNLTSGGFGEIELTLAPDEVAGSLAATSSDAGGIEGVLTVRVRSFARRGRDDWEELTDGVQEITISLQEPEPTEVARRSVPAGTYEAVRTIFGRVEAEVVRGLDVDGEPVVGTIRVDLGPTGTLTVEEAIPFQVRDREAARVTLEMHSRIWLRLVDRARRSVEGDDFRQVFRVRVGNRS